jgi:Helix-turn-helix family
LTKIDADELRTRARALAGAIEPVAGQVYFSPECHRAYEALGFSPSPSNTFNGVHLPDGPAYFTSRGSVMGQVPGEVVAAAFAVFNPEIVVPLVTYGWTLTDAATICDARTTGAVGQLTRVLGTEPAGVQRARDLVLRAAEPLRPEGRPLYSGVRSLGLPGTPLADVWRAADLLREYRGDVHTGAWTSAGFDATEIGLLTELYWGLPMGTYVRTRAWSDDQLDAAKDRLRSRGLLDGDGFSTDGRAQREQVELTTDEQCRPAIEALGDDIAELLGILRPWGAAIRDAGGYLPGGPHELAGQA